MSLLERVRPAEILLVEDSASDALLAQEALASSKVCNNFHVVTDGVEAMAYLRKEGAYYKVSRPDLILLDLNLPRMDGRELLKAVKSDESLKRIPVIALTTSNKEVDVLHAYGLHVNCYIVKPLDFAKFAEAIRKITHFWFTLVTLPTRV